MTDAIIRELQELEATLSYLPGTEARRQHGLISRAIAHLQQSREEIETLKRHAMVDDIAFKSMNHTAVDAEMRAEAAEAELSRLRAEPARLGPPKAPPPIRLLDPEESSR